MKEPEQNGPPTRHSRLRLSAKTGLYQVGFADCLSGLRISTKLGAIHLFDLTRLRIGFDPLQFVTPDWVAGE